MFQWNPSATTLLPFVAGMAVGMAAAAAIHTLSTRKVQDPLKRAFAKIETELTVNNEKLQFITNTLLLEMKEGLRTDGMGLKMLPSYVTNFPTGQEKGTYLSCDLGGTNLRICEVVLGGSRNIRARQKRYTVSEEYRSGPCTVLFDYVADCTAEFLLEYGIQSSGLLYMGFSFSFPVTQTAINKGSLMLWNKGYSNMDVVGNDVVDLLMDAYKRKGLNQIHVKALVNDTVGTLAANLYKDSNTLMAVILGTGTNAAYVADIHTVKKWQGPKPKSGKMYNYYDPNHSFSIINTEWGGFDNGLLVLPWTSYDNQVDARSSSVGIQRFEKMISGMYLGEIVRYILLDLVESGLFGGRASRKLKAPGSFETAFMSRIERDHSVDLSDTSIVLTDLMEITTTTLQDRQHVKRCCELVGVRAARLAAVGISAILKLTNKFQNATVAIDGSLFENYPHFGNRIRDSLFDLIGLSAEEIVIEHARDASGKGAAIVAAVYSK